MTDKRPELERAVIDAAMFFAGVFHGTTDAQNEARAIVLLSNAERALVDACDALYVFNAKAKR